MGRRTDAPVQPSPAVPPEPGKNGYIRGASPIHTESVGEWEGYTVATGTVVSQSRPGITQP